MSELDEATYDRLAYETLQRIDRAFEDVDPDVVEAVPSAGVIKFEFQDGRRSWVVSTQRAARQMWLAAEQRAWHFVREGDVWRSTKGDEELLGTLRALFAEHLGLEVDFAG
ncbi:MAG: iron donor protein CyaY [Planctomycetes bacterium]|nr:iron donor protein CyaY [Planctomycetota bacterium]